MEANLTLIEFFWFCLVIKVIHSYKNSNAVEITEGENGSLSL